MPTPDELRASIATGRRTFREALLAAADGWERAPAGGEGEEAWSARQTAEHVVPVEAFFTTAVCSACGYPGVESPTASYPTAEDAAAAFDEVAALCDGRLKHVTETDLAMQHERFGTVADLLAMNAHHPRGARGTDPRGGGAPARAPPRGRRLDSATTATTPPAATVTSTSRASVARGSAPDAVPLPASGATGVGSPSPPAAGSTTTSPVIPCVSWRTQ